MFVYSINDAARINNSINVNKILYSNYKVYCKENLKQL